MHFLKYFVSAEFDISNKKDKPLTVPLVYASKYIKLEI